MTRCVFGNPSRSPHERSRPGSDLSRHLVRANPSITFRVLIRPLPGAAAQATATTVGKDLRAATSCQSLNRNTVKHQPERERRPPGDLLQR